MDKKRVILVTDGDTVAQKAIERATRNIGGRCISASAGNPTVLTGGQIIELINQTPHDPVVVMVDDRGTEGMGEGEEAMETIIESQEVEVLGVVAVSSNGKECDGLTVSCSITKDGEVIEGAVDKHGNNIGQKKICGDTLSVLMDHKGMIIVGIGDPGKMDYSDDAFHGAPITTKALKEVMRRSGYQH